jgi:two-component system sensor histidine kinase DevS
VRRNPPRQGDCFRQAMDVALTPLGEDANARWRSLLASLFDPLDIRSEPGDPPGVIIEYDGLVMVVPPVRSLTAVRLEFARSGRSLFSPHDVTLANDLVSMLAHALESRSAYEKGATEERSRIARDMHDNIGAQLLAALHSPDTQRKDSKIRETLADLRNVISNVSSQAQDLDEILAELRAETSERLAAGGVHLCWENTTSTRLQRAAPFVHSLRSMIREAVSNILRHSGAGQAYISIQSESNVLTIVIADDGQGFDQATIHPGNGILNLRSRVDLLQGSVHYEDNAPGTRLVICIPITDTRLLK